MKKKLISGILAVAMILLPATQVLADENINPGSRIAATGDIAIDARNFPDEVFRNWIKDNLDEDTDGVLSQTEIDQITHINIPYKEAKIEWHWYYYNKKYLHEHPVGTGIKSVKGIEFFTNLENLDCKGNGLTSIDVSQNKKLKELILSNNPLVNLDVSSNSDLEMLIIDETRIHTVDLSKNTNLIGIQGWASMMTHLDISQNSKIEFAEFVPDQNTEYRQYIPLVVNADNEIDLKSIVGAANIKNISFPAEEKYVRVAETGVYHPDSTYTRALKEDDREVQFLNTDKYTYDAPGGILTVNNDVTLPIEVTYLYDLNKAASWSDGDGNTYADRFMEVNLLIIDETTILEPSNPVPEPPPSSDNVVNFVTRLYQTGLDRQPDQGGLDYWSDGLKAKSLSGAKAAENFLISEEIRNKNLSDDAYLDVLYRALMDRESDAGGKEYWKEFLANGVSRTGVLRQFLLSKEFQGICDTYGITRGDPEAIEPRDENLQLTTFIYRQYKEILGRAGEVGGINFWAESILNGASVEEVSRQFVFSKEFTDKGYSDEDFLKILYRAFMGREYDPAGLAHWQGEINAGMSREDVFTSFAYSKEFKDIVGSFNI